MKKEEKKKILSLFMIVIIDYVTVKSTEDTSEFIRAHVKFYRRITKRDALRMISSVRFLSEVEAMQ